MKKLLTLIILINISLNFQAQIVNIPDANFKNALLNHNPIIDTNNDGEIQVSEAIAFQDVIRVQNHTNTGLIENLTGIEEFINITGLHCYGNLITSLDLSQNTQIIELYCSNNELTSLNITGLVDLTYFSCDNNNLTSLDVSGLTIEGEGLYCDNNNLTSLILDNSTIYYVFCANNSLTELDLSSANVYNIDCFNNQLSTIVFDNNVNLDYLNCSNNNINDLNLNELINLQNLDCSSNQITNIDVSNNPLLTKFHCSNNQITNIDVNNNDLITELYCDNNLLSELNLSNLYNLEWTYLINNPNLTYINLKNGNNENYIIDEGPFSNLPNLELVCIDDVNSNFSIEINDTGHPVTFTEYCSLTPALSNQIDGNVKIDLNNNGCDSSDLSMSNLMVISSNSADSFATFTQNNGDYLLYTNQGDFTTSVTTNLPSYFTVNPNTQTNTFTGFDNTFTADFCITPNQTVNDVNISLIPINQARPGVHTPYRIVFKNVGTTQLNGDVSLEFDGTQLNFSNASETVNTQTNNSVTFNYANLNPFETRTIDLEFDVLATANIDDIINFTTTINPISDDYTPNDNEFHLSQTIVDSFDPNDINILEGASIKIENADQYLHYVIRFQNTGTANAINIVVANMLDANLDWSTLELINTSHPTRVAISNGNDIEFIFENINLPDNTTDEPNSHGFITYKIKPKTAIAIGDIIPNKADIFFDLNEAVETNTAITTIVDALSVNNSTLLNFYIYPTPTENTLNIKSKTEILKIEIYNNLGQKIKESTENKVDISNLTQGIYFIKVEDINGNFGVKKIVKK